MEKFLNSLEMIIDLTKCFYGLLVFVKKSLTNDKIFIKTFGTLLLITRFTLN